MATVYTVGDLLQLTMAMFQYPDGMVAAGQSGKKGPVRAAARPICAKCVVANPRAFRELKVLAREGNTIYLYPTYDDLCDVRHDVAGPKCIYCGGPK